MIGIYKIENKINGKKYIGQSKNIEARWEKHKYDLNNGTHHSKKLQNAWNEYGADNFKFDIIEAYESLDDKEQYYIDLYNTIEDGYNMVDVDYIPDKEIHEKGFTKADNKIMKDIIYNLGFQEYAMYLTLLSHRNYQDGKCYPSFGVLKQEMNCSDRTVKRLVNILYENGYIIINSGGNGKNNEYYFPYEFFFKQDEEKAKNAIRRSNGFQSKKKINKTKVKL